MKKILLFGIFLICGIGSYAAKTKKVTVYNAEELVDAIGKKADTIIVKNGTYNDFNINIKRGIKNVKPLVIIAENPGKVIITGKSTITISTDQVELNGFYFQSSFPKTKNIEKNDPVINIKGSHNRITQCAFYYCNNRASIASLYQEKTDKMPQYNRIDHCYFGENLGWRLYLDLGQRVPSDDLKYAMYHRIDHCYFSTPFKLTANTGSAMRIGLGQLGYGRCLIDNNLFERQDGEVELIENKSHENVYIHNTFRNCQAQMSFRQGHSTIFLHNIMEATDAKHFYGGLGMWMDEHIVAGNYFSFPNGSYVPLDKKMRQRPDRLPASVVRFTCGYKDFIQKDKSYATHLAAQNSIFANNTFFDCKDEPFDLSYEESKLPQMNGYPASRPYGNTIKNNTFAYTGEKADRIYANPNDEDFKLNTVENNIVYSKENASDNPNTIFTIRHKSLDTVSVWMDKVFGHLGYDINKLANSRIAEIKKENGNVKAVLYHQPAKLEEVGPSWLKENPSKFAMDGEYTEELLREIKRNIGD